MLGNGVAVTRRTSRQQDVGTGSPDPVPSSEEVTMKAYRHGVDQEGVREETLLNQRRR